MKVKVFEKNEKGKIEFTRKELEALLNEVFNDGYQEGKSSTWTWTSPTVVNTALKINSEPYYTTTTSGCIETMQVTDSNAGPIDSYTVNTCLADNQEKVEYGVLNEVAV